MRCCGLSRLSRSVLSIPKWAYALALAVAVAGIWGHGYRMASKAGQERLQAFRNEVAAKAAKAQQEAARRVIEAQRITQEVTDAYQDRLNRLNAELRRMRDSKRPDGSRVPTVPQASESPNDAPGECVPLGEYQALEERSARDALKLQELQKWVQEQAG